MRLKLIWIFLICSTSAFSQSPVFNPDSSYSWKWDTVGVSWYNNSKYIPTYDIQWNTLNGLSMSWDSTLWINTRNDVYSYDTSYFLINRLTQFPDGIGWKDTLQSIYSYDGNHNTMEHISQHYNTNGWENNYRILYAYDSSNNQVNRRSQGWDSTGWFNFWQANVDFDTQNNRIAETQQYWTSGAWSNSSYNEMDYDSLNLLIQSTSHDWNPVLNSWVLDDRNIYSYDSLNFMNQWVSLNWNGTTWENYSQRLFINDSAGHQLSSTYQQWVDSSGTWKNINQYLSSYGSNNFIDEVILQTWDGNNWINGYRNSYTYNGQDKMTSFLYQLWKNVAWQNRDSTYYYYSGTTANEEVSLLQKQFIIFPNPVNSDEQLYFVANNNFNNSILELKTISGQILFKIRLDVYQGINLVPFNFENLPASLYFLNLVTTQGNFSAPFVVY